MAKHTKEPAPKHPSCIYFDELVSHLEKEWKGFQLKTLAEQLSCSTERIRRIRIGMVMMDVNDITVLKDNYNANPLFLIDRKLPMQVTQAQLKVVNESQGVYNNVKYQEEIQLLKDKLQDRENMIKDKERIISLYEERFVLPEETKRQKRA